jgi:stress response protein YsnF
VVSSGGLTGTPDATSGTASVVRSEERARVAFPTRIRGRVRLVKHVVTEEVTQTFTLRREELRIEEDPGDEPGAELSWTYQIPGDPSQDDFDIVLHAEQVTASTVVVPVERIRVSHHVVESAVLVSTDIRREQIEVDHDLSAVPTAGDRPAPDGAYDDQTGAADGGTRTSKEEQA